MINPTEQDVGRGVVYRARHEGAPPEDGVITSYNDAWVVVCYGSQHPAAGGHATRRSARH